MIYTMAIDAGNYNVKVCTEKGVYKFCSAICEYDELNVKQTYGADDMEWEYDGLKGFAGTMARYEDEYGDGATYGNTKNHFDAKIRILLAIHKYAASNLINLIVAQPIITHVPQEKEDIISSLEGNHIVTVNGVTKEFKICEVKVAAECAASYYSNNHEDTCRIIDVGSGTVNCASYRNRKYINKESTTLEFGAETSLNNNINFSSMAKGIHRNMSKKWNMFDIVYVCGGATEYIYKMLKNIYPNAELMKPTIKIADTLKVLHAEYANVIGMWNVAQVAPWRQ